MNNEYALARQIKLIKDRRYRILYAYKSHEKAADRAEKMEKWRKHCSVLLTAIGVTTFLTSLVGAIFSAEVSSLVTSFIAVLSTIAALASDIFHFKEDSRAHTIAAIKLRAIYQQYENLIADMESEQISLQDSICRRDAIAKEETELILRLPRTSRSDYRKADKALVSDEQISSFQNDGID